MLYNSILQVGEVKECLNGTLSVRSLQLKDVSSTVKVVLFGSNAQQEIHITDIISISSVYVKSFKGKTQLTTSAKSNIQVQ